MGFSFEKEKLQCKRKLKMVNNMNTKKNKTGEITTQQIVMLIILITSFAVVLFLLLRLDLGAESEKEICHNSVVMKGNSILPEEALELNCQRSYVCLTEDGSCEGLIKPEKIKVKSLDEIYNVLGEKMADCWWMFGEGKIDYVGNTATKNNYCSICNQILFDDSLNNIEGVEDKISKDELYDYFSKTEISEDETYADYLFGTSDMESLKKGIMENEENEEGVGTFGNIEIGKQYYVMMGITSEIGATYKWIGGAVVGLAIVSLAIPGVNFVTSAIIFSAGAGTAGAGGQVAGLFEPEIAAITIKGNGIKNNFMAPTIQEIDSEKFGLLNCEEIITYA
jgi:hypothetical protein